MKKISIIIAALFLIGGLLFFFGKKDQAPVDGAVEAVTEAAKEVKDEVKDAAAEVKEAASEATEEVKEAAEEAKEEVKEATEEKKAE